MTCLRSACSVAFFLATLQITGCFSASGGRSLFSLGGSTTATTSGMIPPKDELPPKQAAQACLATAKELQAHGDSREVILLFERARQLDPREQQVSRFLAVLYDQQGNDTRAEAEYRKAPIIAPHDADLLSDFGYYFYRRQNWKQAEANFRKAMRRRPSMNGRGSIWG